MGDEIAIGRTEPSREKEDPIIRLLTEIRDNQREEIALRRKAVEESIRLQRTAVLWQRMGMGIVVALILGLIWFVAVRRAPV